MKKDCQLLIELTIGLSLLLIVLAGTAELGIALFQQSQLLEAAQEGVAFGSYCQNEALITQRVVGTSNNPVDLLRTDIGIDFAPSPAVEGGQITVSITHHHKVFAPFASVFFGKEIPITGRASGTILKTDGCQ